MRTDILYGLYWMWNIYMYIYRDISTNVGFYNCKIYRYAKKKKNKNIGQKYNTIEKILGTGLEPYTLYYIL